MVCQFCQGRSRVSPKSSQVLDLSLERLSQALSNRSPDLSRTRDEEPDAPSLAEKGRGLGSKRQLPRLCYLLRASRLSTTPTPCHCEQRSDEAIPLATRVIASSEATKQSPPPHRVMARSEATKQSPPPHRVIASSEATKQSPPPHRVIASSEATKQSPTHTVSTHANSTSDELSSKTFQIA